MLDRSIAPPFGTITNPKILRPESVILNNGDPLFIINAGDQPVIKFEIIVESGVWNEVFPGLSWIAAKVLPEGSQKKSANEIAELFEFYGSFIEINPGFDNTSISVYAPKRYFRKVIELLSEIMNTPSFEEKEIEILKTNKIQQIKVNKEKTSFVASRKIREALFGLKHPYGRSLSISEIQNLQKPDIQECFKKSLRRSAEYFVSGQVENQELEIIKEQFGHVSTKNIENELDENKLEKTSDIFIEKPDSVQSSIRLGWLIPDKSHPDHYKITILNEILGGYFSSRLMKNLREEKGYTYGVHSYPVFLRHASFLIVSADVIAESTNDAIAEIHKEVDTLKSLKVPEDELETVRNYMAGSFLSSVSTTFQLMEKFKSIHAHDLDYSYYDGFFDALNNIAPDDLIETAYKYFQSDNLHTVVVGKK